MTRINVGVNPIELTNKHLLAEHREMKRIPNNVARGKYNMKNTPKAFCLGKGHVAFFYDKLLYLKNRYEEVYAECIRRGFDVQYWGGCWDGVPVHLMNDYNPTERDRFLLMERINERLNKNKR